ncbi:MAG TPA: hypothetical protein VN914_12795, partial [Polyangia bacterium]|nr:hypothetical protein [Polyangia bacterium]
LRRTTDNAEATHGQLFGPMPNNEFAAPIDLSNVNSGDYQLIVSGATSGGTKGMAVAAVRVDSGPRIEINSPKENGSYKGSVTVQVTIDSAPFGPTSNVTASIGVLPIALNPTGVANNYEALVEFLKLASPLEGDQVLKVTATNVAGTRSESSVRFTIDNRGPEITATEPKEAVVVGGIIRIRAKVTDQSGVLGSSVTAVIGNRQDVNFKVELKPEAETGFYSELFDTTRLTACKPPVGSSLCIIFPNLSFRASDRAGNESVLAYDISVDNQGPLLDLNPDPIRLKRYDPETKRLVCSHAFNPVGDYQGMGDMPRDLCVVPQVFDLRARIEDNGNWGDGLKFSPISGVDPATPAIYVLPDTSQPLVVDLDGDGWCDAINPKLVPTTRGPIQSNEVLATRLSAVPVKGTADFTMDPSLVDTTGRLTLPPCNPGRAVTGPPRLCGSQTLTMAIGYPAARGPSPSIWSLEIITPNEPWCVGSQFDAFANEIPDGQWACIAAGATDRLGNSGVSNPLRVWVAWDWDKAPGFSDRAGPACPAPPGNAGPPPNCTGSYNRQTGTVSATPCKAPRFVPQPGQIELINEGALPEGGMGGM